MLRVITICLLISNIVLGTVGYLILRDVDSKYSALLTSSLPSLNAVRALSWQLVIIQRPINRLADTAGPARDQLLGQQVRDIDEATGLLSMVSTAVAPAVQKATVSDLVAAHRAYIDSVLKWRGLIAGGQVAEASALVVKTVRPAYDNYGGLLVGLATQIHDSGITGSRQLSADTSKLGGELVFASMWPLWLAGVALGLIWLCVISLGALIRWRAPDLLDS